MFEDDGTAAKKDERLTRQPIRLCFEPDDLAICVRSVLMASIELAQDRALWRQAWAHAAAAIWLQRTVVTRRTPRHGFVARRKC
jgi:hypothetical protein